MPCFSVRRDLDTRRRVTEITIKGNRAEVRVLKDGLTGATGVTLVGGTAFVLVERTKGVAVPYSQQ